MSSSSPQDKYKPSVPNNRKQFPTSNMQENREVDSDTKVPVTTSAKKIKTTTTKPSTQPPKKAAWVEPPVVESHMDFKYRPSVEQHKWAAKVMSQKGPIPEALVEKMHKLFPDRDPTS
ncbi:hypothetical protein NHQ30_005878 [Ciborinia camelliae]|nr:hypothetical protein NHQ30_005878 [Ciborinia camelliae]